MKAIPKTEKISPSILRFLSKRGTGIVMVVVLLILGIRSPMFFNPNNLMDVLKQGGILTMLALGITLVLVPGGFDMGAGATMQLTCNIAAALILGGMPPMLTVPVGILAGLVVGLFNAFLVLVMRIPTFVGTLGTMFVLQGVTQMINKGKVMNIGTRPFFTALGQGHISIIPVIFIIVLIMMVVIHLYLKHTQTGLRMYASGQNPQAAAIRGIVTGKYMLIGYVLSGTVIGFTGVVQCSYIYGSTPIIAGIDFLIQALVAAYLGTTFSKTGELSIIGSTICGFFIAALSSALIINGISNRQISGILGVILILSILVTVIRKREIGQVTIF
ncbi:MAG: ABC transporter permease [Treponema sp.]|jgi:ribose/xylose/arabinose/galactoside ABC-type transport system permease subunit|nr:ABC transporter permease [Treponema sp.]